MSRSIPTKETLTVEFKGDKKKKYGDADLFADVVAFANTEGGDLYIGVEDDGEITGVHKDHSDPLTLSAYIANNTVPPLSVRTEIVDEIYPVLKVSVPKFQGGIVATSSGKVMRRRIKMDNTPENIPLYPNEWATRQSDLRLLDYSAMPITEASLDDIDVLEIERLRKIILAYDGDKALLELDNSELMKALGFVRVINDVSLPTVTGLLMVGKTSSLQRFIPTHQSSFQVLEGTTTRINEDYTLPVLAIVEKLFDHIHVWNPTREFEMGLFRMSIPEFNVRAIREGIVNAFSHRDYTKMGRVRVAIDDDGLTVTNPGGFIEGVSIQNLLTAEPHGRNQLLADALKRVGLAERSGRGIDRIFEGSLIYGRALPDYSLSTSIMVSLIIPRSKIDPQMTKLISEEQARLGRPLPINTLLVLNELKESPKSNVNQIVTATNLTVSAVRNILDKSIEKGIVEGYGSGRGRTYSIAHALFSDKTAKVGYVRQTDIDEVRCLEMITTLAKSSEFISRADVIELLHITPSKAYGLLRKLVNSGILTPVNSGRYAKYRLTTK